MRCGEIAQLARASGSYPAGRWFESISRYHLNNIEKFKNRSKHRQNRLLLLFFITISIFQIPYTLFYSPSVVSDIYNTYKPVHIA